MCVSLLGLNTTIPLVVRYRAACHKQPRVPYATGCASSFTPGLPTHRDQLPANYLLVQKPDAVKIVGVLCYSDDVIGSSSGGALATADTTGSRSASPSPLRGAGDEAAAGSAPPRRRGGAGAQRQRKPAPLVVPGAPVGAAAADAGHAAAHQRRINWCNVIVCVYVAILVLQGLVRTRVFRYYFS